MVTYRILIVTGAGTGGWTSHQAAKRIVEELNKKGFEDVETKLCRDNEAPGIVQTWKPDAAITIIGKPEDLQLPKDLPTFMGVPLVSGVGMEPIVEGIAKVLKDPHWAGIKRS
jgi:galactitol-specific phosphotransferase system IIB component